MINPISLVFKALMDHMGGDKTTNVLCNECNPYDNAKEYHHSHMIAEFPPNDVHEQRFVRTKQSGIFNVSDREIMTVPGNKKKHV